MLSVKQIVLIEFRAATFDFLEDIARRDGSDKLLGVGIARLVL